MATYQKPLKTFELLTLMGFTANAEDTADGKRIGSYAIDALEAHETIETEGTDKKVLVPFHAVKKAEYSITTADAEKEDPYCGGGSEPTGETYTLIWTPWHKNGNTCESTDPVTQENVKIGDALDFPCRCLEVLGPGWYLKHDYYDDAEKMFFIEEETTLTEQIVSYAKSGVIEIHQECTR